MMLVVGRDDDCVEWRRVEHFVGGGERSLQAVPFREFTRAADIGVANGRQFGFVEMLQSVRMRRADPAAANQSKSYNLYNLRHLTPLSFVQELCQPNSNPLCEGARRANCGAARPANALQNFNGLDAARHGDGERGREAVINRRPPSSGQPSSAR